MPVVWRVHLPIRRKRCTCDSPSGADVPRKPIWCFFDTKDFTYTVSSLPLELCSAIVFCCLDLSKGGDSVAVLAADEERYSAIAERRKAYPWVRLFVGVGGPRAMVDGFRALASADVTNTTVVRLCRSLHKFSERTGGEGVLSTRRLAPTAPTTSSSW
ncbi:hypothetical protein MTO96_049349 [Rhipicephalus appendiculatus]